MIDFLATEKELKNVVTHFESELQEFRTGRAQISMVENILVDAYGSKTPLMHVAALSTPDPRSILIKPWDRSVMPAIGEAIQKSSLGLAPIADSEQIRITIPAPTEERRKEMVKLMGKKTEEARISIRRTRDDLWKAIQEGEREGEISEDQKFSQKEKMEKMIEQYNGRIGEIAEKKEKEILEK
jgi:ribosome recycling factor